MSFNCLLCKKDYKSYHSFWKHNNIFHPNEIIIIERNDNKIRNFNCDKCNKKFRTKQNMLSHIINACKANEPIINEPIIKNNTIGNNTVENTVENNTIGNNTVENTVENNTIKKPKIKT